MSKRIQIYQIEKNKFKTRADRWFRQNCPSERSRLTSRLISETIIYMKGYGKAMQNYVDEPIIIDDMNEFLIQDGLEYIEEVLELNRVEQ